MFEKIPMLDDLSDQELRMLAHDKAMRIPVEHQLEVLMATQQATKSAGPGNERRVLVAFVMASKEADDEAKTHLQ